MEWSKSIYSYGMAVCLLEIGGEDVEMRKEAAHLMGQVPSLRQKIAGKSIPLEVCHASYHFPSFTHVDPFLSGRVYRNL
jgi:hypothetical protein